MLQQKEIYGKNEVAKKMIISKDHDTCMAVLDNLLKARLKEKAITSLRPPGQLGAKKLSTESPDLGYIHAESKMFILDPFKKVGWSLEPCLRSSIS